MLEDFNPELNNPISEMTLAGAGGRLVAAIIDWLIVNIPLGIIQTIVFGASSLTFDLDEASELNDFAALAFAGGISMFYLFSIAVRWSYFAYMESSEKQATFGKQAMNIVVVSNDGQRLSFMNALGRVAAKVLSGWICCIGYIMILFRADEKGLHDLLANTYVVKA